jgi:hypothetical protein
MNWKGCVWKQQLPALHVLAFVGTEELDEGHSEYLYNDQDLNPDSFEYKAGVLTT